jgi:hypothetical protein
MECYAIVAPYVIQRLGQEFRNKNDVLDLTIISIHPMKLTNLMFLKDMCQN